MRPQAGTEKQRTLLQQNWFKMLEVAALVFTIINAIFAGFTVPRELWRKLKGVFRRGTSKYLYTAYHSQGRSKSPQSILTDTIPWAEKPLKDQPRSVLESHLTPILTNDKSLALAMQNHYQAMGLLQGAYNAGRRDTSQALTHYSGWSSGRQNDGFWDV